MSGGKVVAIRLVHVAGAAWLLVGPAVLAADDRLSSIKDGLKMQTPSVDSDAGLERTIGIGRQPDVGGPEGVTVPAEGYVPSLDTGMAPMTPTVPRPVGSVAPVMPAIDASQRERRQERLPAIPGELEVPTPDVRGGTTLRAPSLPSFGSKAEARAPVEPQLSADLFLGYIVTISSDDCAVGTPSYLAYPPRELAPAGRRSAWGAAVKWLLPRGQRAERWNVGVASLVVWQTRHPVDVIEKGSAGKPGVSEYLGPTEEGYVYALIPEEAEEACPDIRSRIAAVLGIRAHP